MHAWKAGSGEKTADLMSVLTRDCGISKNAVQTLIIHGHVTIDGYTIRREHLRKWKVRQLRGRMLKAGRIQMRLYSDGGRLSADHEQQAMRV